MFEHYAPVGALVSERGDILYLLGRTGRYLEPQEPIRQTFLYNNLMYAAVGYMINSAMRSAWSRRCSMPGTSWR
jgi:hypothetical protein